MVLRILLLVLSVLLPPIDGAVRAERVAAPSDLLSVSVRPGWRLADGRHVAGLSIRLAPGWKTYWRAPGVLGIPPRMDWSRSRNLRAASVAWPRPQVIAQGGGHALGYDAAVVVPLLLRPERAGAPIRLRGQLSLGVCRAVCVPVDLRVEARLPAGGAPDPAIREALAEAPMAMPAPPRCRTAPVEDGLALDLALDVPPLGGAEAVAVELPDPSLWITDARTRREDGVLRARVEVLSRGALALDRASVRVTAVGRDRAYEAVGCVGG